MRRVVILGSTGSVGESAVRVAAALRDRIHVTGVVGNRNVKRLAEQAALLGCEFAATGSPERLGELASALPPSCRAYAGTEAVAELVQAENVDMILCAIVGTAGFPLVLSAIDAGKEIALASKEVLVMAGRLVMDRVREKNIRLIPVDSEHSAIFQCLQGHGNVRNVVLTASGGPFRKSSKEELARVTCADALKHPTWSMGPKVTIDSASLMNKALEMVEAHHLFHVGADRIKVLVHPQSIVHSMAEFEDGAFHECSGHAFPDSVRVHLAGALRRRTEASGSDRAFRADVREAGYGAFPVAGLRLRGDPHGRNRRLRDERRK